MKKKLSLFVLFLSTAFLGLNAALNTNEVAFDFNSIDLAKISDKAKDFAMSLSDSSLEAIKQGAENRLKNLPNEAFGVNILALKDNIINSDIANKINQELPKLYQTIQNTKPFVKDPQTGLMLVTTLYTVMSAQIPQSIKNFYVSILAFGKKIVDSTKAEDVAAVAALKNIIIAADALIEKLYQNRNNLANALTAQDKENFLATVKNNIDAVKALVERNGKELQDILAKARAISAADLASFKQTFETGLATAKGLLS